MRVAELSMKSSASGMPRRMASRTTSRTASGIAGSAPSTGSRIVCSASRSSALKPFKLMSGARRSCEAM